MALILFKQQDTTPFKVTYNSNSFTLFDFITNKNGVIVFPKGASLTLATENNEIIPLNLPDDVYFHSIYFINSWFSRETTRLLGEPNFISFQIQTFGPYSITGLPYTSTTYDGSIASLNRVFLRNKAIEQGVNTVSFDITLYAYVDTPANLDGNGMRSQAGVCDKEAIIEFHNNYNYYAGAMDTMFHELFHDLGAKDYYSGYACLETPTIYEKCIMCAATIPIDRHEICQGEAKDIGWQDNNTNGILDVKESGMLANYVC